MDLPGGDGGVTSGVKVVTYFNLHLKPLYGQHQRELRERALHPCIDTGPAPSGRHCKGRRFIGGSVHCSTPVPSRRSLGDSKAYGTTSAGGEQCSGTLNCSGISEACKVGAEGAGNPADRAMGLSPRSRPGSWPRRLESRLQGRWQRRFQGQRKRKRQRKGEMEGPRCNSKRVGKGQGEGRREEMTVGSDYGVSPLAKAVEMRCVSVSGSTWQDGMAFCDSLKRTGCALAWFIATGEAERETTNSRMFKTLFHTGAWPRADHRRSALPIRVGEFFTLVEFLKSNALTAVVSDDLVEY